MVRILLPLLLLLLLCPLTLPAAEYQGRVLWIYDGDTIKVEGIGKVRLLGIDTPEYKASGRDNYYRKKFNISPSVLRKISQKAKEFNIDLTKNKRVRLSTEKHERDKHGRLLAYVYLPDGTMLNRLLLKNGLATVFRRFDFRHKKKFLELESKARSDQRGLWR